MTSPRFKSAVTLFCDLTHYSRVRSLFEIFNLERTNAIFSCFKSSDTGTRVSVTTGIAKDNSNVKTIIRKLQLLNISNLSCGISVCCSDFQLAGLNRLAERSPGNPIAAALLQQAARELKQDLKKQLVCIKINATICHPRLEIKQVTRNVEYQRLEHTYKLMKSLQHNSTKLHTKINPALTTNDENSSLLTSFFPRSNQVLHGVKFLLLIKQKP